MSWRSPSPITVFVAVSLAVVALGGCASTTAGTSSSTAPASTAASGSTQASASRQAFTRGTKVTLTNGTSSAVEVKPYTVREGEGSYAALAAGASTSATSEWTAGTYTRTIFYIKRPAGGVVGLLMQNSAVGTPYAKTCESSELTGCDDDKNWTGTMKEFDENQTQTMSTTGGAATFTVTRGSDDDDNKNWTATLDALS